MIQALFYLFLSFLLYMQKNGIAYQKKLHRNALKLLLYYITKKKASKKTFAKLVRKGKTG